MNWITVRQKQTQKNDYQLGLAMTSPLYFHRVVYSDDKEQSCLKFTNYKDLFDGYLLPIIRTYYEFLKPDKYMIINISDVKLIKQSFKYIFTEFR